MGVELVSLLSILAEPSIPHPTHEHKTWSQLLLDNTFRMSSTSALYLLRGSVLLIHVIWAFDDGNPIRSYGQDAAW
jgi:hypothetical protein